MHKFSKSFWVFFQWLNKIITSYMYHLQYLDGAQWGNLSGLQKKAVCHSLYYAINWIRELVSILVCCTFKTLWYIDTCVYCLKLVSPMQLNAFSTQVASRVDNFSQKARDETAVKLLKRLRNLMWVYTHCYCAWTLLTNTHS